MELTSTKTVPASVEETYAALTNAQFLKDCIPGCESIEDAGDGKYQVTLSAKIGPVSAKFKGSMSIVDPRPPTAYKLVFEGKAGPAGFAKGSADVALAAEAAATSMTYTVNADVGGKLAQVGARLIEGAAKKVADDFFGVFIAKMQARTPPAATTYPTDSTLAAPASAFALPAWKVAAIAAGAIAIGGITWLLR